MKPFLVFLSCLIALGSQAQHHFESAFDSINRNVQGRSEAYGMLKTATGKIGHRLTGSENGRRAEEMAFNLLRSYGFSVRFQSFETESWSRISHEVRVGNGNGELKLLPSVTLAHSPVSADVRAELIDMGNGLEEDYLRRKDSVKGKIALVYLGILPGSPGNVGSLHRSEKTAIAIRHGAVGIILINTVEHGVLLTGTASVTGKLIPIPAVCIGLEDGLNLKEQIKGTRQIARLKMANFSGPIKARNIIATWPGKQYPGEKIVVAGHLDSWDLASGAIDNGIGAFAVMDMARALHSLNMVPLRTMEFVLFMGEEQGLLGSKAYIKQARSTGQLDKIRYMLNFDMTNDPKGFATSREEMEPLFKKWGSLITRLDSGFKNIFFSGAWLHSDHQPFMLEGIPIGGGTGGELPNHAGDFYHSDRDTFELVDEQGLKNTVRFGAMLAYALANIGEIPVLRQNETALKQFLQGNNLQEPLTIAGEWRW